MPYATRSPGARWRAGSGPSVSRRTSCLAVAVVATIAALSACSGSMTSATPHRDTRSRSATTAPPSTVPPTTTTVLTLPSVTEVLVPTAAAGDGYRWYVYPVGGGPNVMLAVRRNGAPGTRPAVLVDDTSGGFNLDYLDFADELVARGFDVVVGCLYTPPDPLDQGGGRIPCADAPLFDGVAETMVAQLDALVAASYDALGGPTQLAVMGFSRGAGIAALRASGGRPEPVVLVSGRYEGWTSAGTMGPPGPLDVADRADRWLAPTLILHGTSDGAVPIREAYRLEAALRGVGVDVQSHYYDGGGHNLAGETDTHDDLDNRTVGFLCAHFACPG
jgi:dienelactone hydrolase